MNQYLAKRLYLIIIVVTSVTIGFITGYIVGLKHQGGSPEQKRASELTPKGLQTDTQASLEMRPLQDMEIKDRVAQVHQEPAKKDQTPENPEEKLKNVQEEKGQEGHGASEERLRQLLPQKGPYTVQVGAFKNKKEAEALKTKLEKKGYNIYIKEDKQKKVASLFKVRLGGFETKKEAEIFAVRLSKTEGLQAIAVRK